MPHHTRCLVLTGGFAADGPYGIDKFENLGYELVEVKPASHRLHRKARDVIEHRTGMPLDKTLRSTSRAWKSDLVLAFLEREALTAAALARRGVPPYANRPLAMICCWLADELREMSSENRRRAAARYQGVDLTIVFSENQIDILVDAGFPEGSVEAVPFGFADETFTPQPFDSRTPSITAVGFDRGRDYATLMEAVRGTNLRVDLYCKPQNIAGIPLPDNVEFHGVVPFDRYRQAISSAQIIAVPTREMAYPSGQTVALEAGATGACLVLTRTPALSTYFTDDTALLCDPGDVQYWREALMRATEDSELREGLGAAAARDIRSRFTYTQMWKRIDDLFRDRGWVSS